MVTHCLLDARALRRALLRRLLVAIGLLALIAVAVDSRTAHPLHPALLVGGVGIGLLALLGRYCDRCTTQLAESRARNRAIVDNIVDGAIHSDHRGHLVGMNAAAERIFGYLSSAVRGQPLSMLLAPQARPQIDALWPDLPAATSGGNCRTHELIGRRRDGSEFPLALAISAVELGGLVVYTAIARDLTEAHARLQELARARDDALAADRAKGQFLAVMSHEIRTPMNGLLGMLDLLRDSPLSDQQRELIATAEHSGQLLLGLINDILDLSKIEAGKVELHPTDFDLHATIEEISSLAANQVRDRDLELANLIAPEVPSWVHGDAYRLRQVLLNLVGNAVKFTPAGEVVVTVEAIAATSDPLWLRIAVRDTGIGIPAAVQPLLFRPFVQGDASTTRRYGGTGLGLVIAHRLVGLMGGDMGFDSEPGLGSTFWFTLPLRPALTQPPTEPRHLSGVSILVVDDNATNRLILQTYLSSWGAVPVAVPGATEALAQLHAAAAAGQPFALAILDLQMPAIDGLELATRIKGDPALAATPLVLLSSMGYPGTEARRVGIALSLLKPVRRGLLHDALIQVLQPARDAPRQTPPGDGPRFVARVLIAEDNPVNQRVAALMLNRLGVSTEVVDNGAEALAAVMAQPYDLVLMDMQMPGLDGLEGTRRIRAWEQSNGRARVPIIAMTAAVTPSDRARCRAAGMDAFLAKPLVRADLEAGLRRWLDPRLLAGANGHTAPGPADHSTAP